MTSRQKRARTTEASTSGTANDAPASRPPWPRREGTRIPLGRNWEDPPAEETAKAACVNRDISEDWDDYDTLFYNAWLSVEIAPTRVADPKTLQELGIKEDVLRLLKNAGMGTIATKQYDLFPDLVRQFLATVRVYYQNEVVRNAREGTLTFLIRGVRYRVPLHELCVIYGFDNECTGTSLPPFQDTPAFWDYFGRGRYDSKDSTHTDIRHPVLRYIARLFATTLLCKHEPGKMRVSEMVMLYRAIGELTPAEDVTELDDDISLGAVFAHHLVSLKRTPFLSSARKPETVGSLLTPIFRHCGIDTTTCSVVSKRALMDLDYLQRATWMKPGKRWVFANSQKELVTVQLPERELTHITDDPDCLRFQPDPNLVHALPPTRRRGASSRLPASSAEDTPVRVRASSSRHDTAAAIPEPIGPHYLPDAPEIPMEPAVFQRYVVQSFQAIWNAITVVSNCGCVRPPTPPDDE